MRPTSLLCLACIWLLAITHGAVGDQSWTLGTHTAGNGKSCSLSRMDRGRAFSVTLAVLPDSAGQGVVGLTFDEPRLVRNAKKGLATLQFDDRAREGHRIEVTPAGPLLVAIVALNLEDVLQTFSASRKLTVTTRFGSSSFSLDGIGDRIPALRKCAGG